MTNRIKGEKFKKFIVIPRGIRKSQIRTVCAKLKAKGYGITFHAENHYQVKGNL